MLIEGIIMRNQIQQCISKIKYHDQVGLFQQCKVVSILEKWINEFYYLNRIKKKNRISKNSE